MLFVYKYSLIINENIMIYFPNLFLSMALEQAPRPLNPYTFIILFFLLKSFLIVIILPIS